LLGRSSDTGVVVGHPKEFAGVGVGRAVCAATCEAAGDPPSGPQAARTKDTSRGFPLLTSRVLHA